MKTKVFDIIHSVKAGACACMLFVMSAVMFSACNEDISEDNFAIKTEQNMMDFLQANPDRFSDLISILERVRLGKSDDASTLSSVLTARGNYTLFAPNNEALEYYMDSIGVAGVDELTYEQAELIAYSCIIDNGDESAYEAADFPATGTFTLPNLSQRRLTCMQVISDNGDSYYVIGGYARVVGTDNEVSNGMVHELGSVVAPSSDNLYQRIAAAGNMKVMARLMELTTWADSMDVPLYDEEYEDENHNGTYLFTGVGTFTIAESLRRGFTALVEPDEVLANWLGMSISYDEEGNVTNWDNVLAQLKTKCEAVYGTADADDLSSPDNAVNRFVAYHIMYGIMAYDRFVRHFNEHGYTYGPDMMNPQTSSCPTNVWEYYTTVGKYPGLIKITQVGDGSTYENAIDHPIYANRISVYDTDPYGDYTEIGVKEGYKGLLIQATNGDYDNDALNGYYFPIDGVLLYDGGGSSGMGIRDQLGEERIRMDVTTMLPEMASNNYRGGGYTRFPNGYFSNISNESSSTVIVYLNCAQAGALDPTNWRDFQGDEIMAGGQYDFVLKLPPVPKDGTYELRMGVSHNSMRGMAQIYFGTNPNSLSPVGLPYDMRQPAGTEAIPWTADIEGDTETNTANDKLMRNQGFMKAPKYFKITSQAADASSVRDMGGSVAALRRIVTARYMSANETYYIKFKSVLKDPNAQFFLDYFEYVPASVYNGVTGEDIW